MFGTVELDFDCERIVDGLLRQPVNALSTLVIVVGGVVIMRRPSMRWVGIALAATGLGSLLFHGPMPAWGEWIHDVTLAWLILIIAGWARSWEKLTHWPGLVVFGVLFGFFPALGDPAAVVLTVGALISLLARDRTRATIPPLLLLGTVALLGRLGATGGPLCRPDSLFQWHAVWHIGAAVAVVWWASGRPEELP